MEIFKSLGRLFGPGEATPAETTVPRTPRPSPLDNVPVQAAEQARIRALLKRMGHTSGRVNGLDISSRAKLIRAMHELHGVSDDEYRAAGGTV